MDKHLPLIHPYMVVDQGEAHHLRRYPRSPRVGLLVEKETDTDARDLQIVTDICCRTALNLKTRLEFSLTTEAPILDVTQRITSRTPSLIPLPRPLSATDGLTINPPGRLTLFNGSPRGRRGNTPIFLNEFAKGFGGPTEMYDLIRVKSTDEFVQAFAEAECVWLGFPLYTDSMPGIVKHFIDALQPFVGRKNNPSLGFVVQSGFPEGLHSRYVERYLEKLAERLGSAYLGTIVKGNGEGVRIMSAEANKGLFEGLQSLGANLAANGCLDTKTLVRVSHPERFPSVLSPVFKIFVRLPLAHSYFDNMLKTNNVYEQRFAQPFVK